MFDLPQINKIENFIINPTFVFHVFCFTKFQHPITSSAQASFRARDLLFARSSCLSANRHTLFQHVSSSTVITFWNFNLYVAEVVGHFIEVQ